MRNRLHVEGQVQGRGTDAQHHSIGVGIGNGGAKAANFDLNASSPNLNLGSAGLSTNALHQHVNGGGQHTLPKVSKTIISASIESNFNCHLPPAACIQL